MLIQEKNMLSNEKAINFSLANKKAIVTGGNSGIGRAASEALCAAGAKVVILDVNKDTMINAETLPGEASGIICNLMDRAIREQGFNQAVDLLSGELNILVNCAGLQRKGALLDYPEEAWDKVLEINLNAVFSMCKLAGKHMVAQNNGKIINVASMNSFFGGTNACAYSASKGAIAQFTKAIANEWARFGVNANAIAPGFIKTSMTSEIQKDMNQYNFKLSRIPAGRWGEPDDIKGAIVFLASNASDYINGAVIPIDGGYLCK
jgi:Dehydrogenases with different specificities (related to short-chain alcohol dehydrogenases)